MLQLRIKPVCALTVMACMASALVSTPAAMAQAEPDTPTEVQEDENAPVVPTKPFPSLVALDQRNQVWTLKVSGGRVKVNGDVIVNSPNRGALWMADGSLEVSNGTLGVVGNVSRLGRNTIQPAPALGAHALNDPFPEFLIPPPDKVISREKLFLRTEAGGDDTVLPPGIYNGGIFATGNGHITLQPGVFVVANGDFSAIGPTVEGKDVTIIMAGDEVGGLSFSLGAKLNASAPTTGKLKDLVVVSRASGTFAKGVSFAVAQGRLKGIIYAPGAPVSVQSKGSLHVSKIVALSVDVTSATLNVTGAEEEIEEEIKEEPVAPAEEKHEAQTQ
jgi:hypothetical protein